MKSKFYVFQQYAVDDKFTVIKLTTEEAQIFKNVLKQLDSGGEFHTDENAFAGDFVFDDVAYNKIEDAIFEIQKRKKKI